AELAQRVGDPHAGGGWLLAEGALGYPFARAPLTPALSQGEREKKSPLPLGEGWVRGATPRAKQLLGLLRDPPSPLRVARRDDGQQAGMRLGQYAMRGEHDRLLAGMRAGGEPDRPAAQPLAQPLE